MAEFLIFMVILILLPDFFMALLTLLGYIIWFWLMFVLVMILLAIIL
jgi:hypothetical protein